MRRPWVAAAAAGVLLLVLSACGAAEPSETTGAAETIRVPADAATISAAAERVAPGGLILVSPGTYDEQVLIETPDVTIRGENRNTTVIDGGGVRPYGVVAIADGVRIENLTVTGATFYGVLITGLHDENGPSAPTADGYERWDPADFPPLQRFLVDHVTAYDNGLYGIYSFNSQHGVIRDSYASGSSDSGIYVGQCRDCDILVTGNVAERSAVGFENANASDSVVVVGNRFSGNRVGMTLLSSYQEAFTPQRANQVIGNVIDANAGAETPAQAEGGFAIGVGISGGVENVVARNLISGHARAGVVLANTEDLPASGNVFDGNVFSGNGVDIANLSTARTPASGNCATGTPTTTPSALGAQLAAACEDPSAPQDAASELGGPAAPAGVSFRKVPAPRDQPDLPERDRYDKLPAEIAMPDLDHIQVPAPDLLITLTGSR